MGAILGKIFRQYRRNLNKGLGRRSLNELLALHFSLVAPFAIGWAVTDATGPQLLHHVCGLVTGFYGFFGWAGWRIWNQRAWRTHFRPRSPEPAVAAEVVKS